jgi:hypothetical protein
MIVVEDTSGQLRVIPDGQVVVALLARQWVSAGRRNAVIVLEITLTVATWPRLCRIEQSLGEHSLEE